MASRATGAPLRVLLIPARQGPTYQTACTALQELGLELVEPADASGTTAAATRARLRSADLLVLLLDETVAELDRGSRMALLRQGRPIFVCIATGLGTGGEPEALLGSGAMADPSVVFTMRYEGIHDLRWKLAQAISSYLSSRFREAQRQQGLLHSGDRKAQRAAMLDLAVRRDARLRQLAARLALSHVSQYPEDAEAIARQLVAASRVGAYAVAAEILREVYRRRPEQANLLLYELTSQSPAFRTWVFDHLHG